MTDPTPKPHDLDALLGTLRAHRPDTSRHEYGFETRLLARLREERSASIFTWAWRLCPYFALLAIAAAYWGHTASADAPLWSEVEVAAPEQTLASFMSGDLAVR